MLYRDGMENISSQVFWFFFFFFSEIEHDSRLYSKI